MLIVAMELQQWVPSALFSKHKTFLTAVSTTDVSSSYPCDVIRNFCPTLTKMWGFLTDFLKVVNIKFYENPFSWSHSDIYAGRQTDIREETHWRF
jgi:hypothetical protein